MSDPEMTWEKLRAGIRKMEIGNGLVPTVPLPYALPEDVDVAPLVQRTTPEPANQDSLQVSFRIQRGLNVVEADQISQTGFLETLRMMNMGGASDAVFMGTQQPASYQTLAPYVSGYASEGQDIPLAEVPESSSKPALQKMNAEELRTIAISAAGVIGSLTTKQKVDAFMNQLHRESPEVVAPLMIILKNKLASVAAGEALPAEKADHEKTKKRGGVPLVKRLLIGALAFSLTTGVSMFGVRKITSEKIAEECIAATDIDLSRTGLCAVTSGLQDSIKRFIK